MFCINCGAKKTQVKNSRPSKSQATVWRRRHCKECGYTFTSREEVAGEHEILIVDQNGTQPLSIPRLCLSLSRLLAHRGDEAADEAFWLAKTIRASLSGPEVTRQQLIGEVYTVLDRFDTVAALQYASRHGLITQTRRRPGRPRLKRA